MAVSMNGEEEDIKETLDEIFNELKRETPILNLSFNENINKNNKQFNLDLVKTYINTIKQLYPQKKYDLFVTYIMKENYILDTDNCRELEKIDNYLRKNYSIQLLIKSKEEILSNGFRSVINANRKIDEIANKINNTTYKGGPLSPFEKFMLVYEEVTNHIYKSDGRFMQYSSNHWVPVLNGDKIVCTGYASLLKAICERVFSSDEIKVFENHMKVYKKNSDIILGGHANNVVFIKDEKYKINGMFYVDACWDSKRENIDKTYAYCCIPIIDIMKEKKHSFSFEYFTPGNIEETFEELFNPNKNKKKSFLDKINIFKKINGFFESLEFKEDISLQHFIDNYDSLPNKSIVPIDAFINSFKIIGVQKGLEGKNLEEFVKYKILITMNQTIESFDHENCLSCFATTDIERLKKETTQKRK